MTPSSIPRRGDGQSLTEFALVLPILLLIVFGVIDFGRAIFAYTTLSELARQADRTAIVDQTVATVKDQAISSAPALNLQASDVNVCFYKADTAETTCVAPPLAADACTDIGCLALVTASTTFQPITPVISTIVGSIAMSSTSVGPIEFVCPTATKPTCP